MGREVRERVEPEGRLPYMCFSFPHLCYGSMLMNHDFEISYFIMLSICLQFSHRNTEKNASSLVSHFC